MPTLEPGSVTYESEWPEDGCPLCEMGSSEQNNHFAAYASHMEVAHDRAGLTEDEVTGVSMGDDCARCGQNMSGVRIMYCYDCRDEAPDEIAALEAAEEAQMRERIAQRESQVPAERWEHFAWKKGDVTLEPSAWMVAYQDEDGSTRLVQSLDDLIQHCLQEYPDTDLSVALGQIADKYGAAMPAEIRSELFGVDLAPEDQIPF